MDPLNLIFWRLHPLVIHSHPHAAAWVLMPAVEQTWSIAEESSFVSVGYVRRLSPDAGLGSPCVSPFLVGNDGKDRLFVDVRYINRFIRPRKFK